MISNMGDVYSLVTKRFIGTIGSVGYPTASLSGFGTKSIHVLVLETFNPKPISQDKLYVNHKDLNKENNCIDNLEWVTPARNSQHARENGAISYGDTSPTSKLRSDQVVEICKRLQNNESSKVIAEDYEVLNTTIHQIKSGRNWRHISKDYLFKIADKSDKLGDDVVRSICEMISSGVKRSEIQKSTGVSIDILKAIRLRRNYSKISKDYKW